MTIGLEILYMELTDEVMCREYSGKRQLWCSPSPPPPSSPSSLFHPSSLLSLLAEIGWVLLTAFTLCPKGNLASCGSYAKTRSLDNCLRI